MDWLNLLAVQGTLKSLLQHHSSKASILQCSAFFIVQLSHPYMTTGKTIALTRWTFVGKVMSLLFNMLSRLVVTFPSLTWLLKVFAKALQRVRDFWNMSCLSSCMALLNTPVLQSVWTHCALGTFHQQKKVTYRLRRH